MQLLFADTALTRNRVCNCSWADLGLYMEDSYNKVKWKYFNEVRSFLQIQGVQEKQHS